MKCFDVELLDSVIAESEIECSSITSLEFHGWQRAFVVKCAVYPMTDEVHDEIIALMEDEYHTCSVDELMKHPDYEHVRSWEGHHKVNGEWML